jgi:hypothetical protein
MDADGTRPAPGFGAVSVLMPPGRYTVKLTVDGQSYTQPLEMLKDPNEPVITAQDIQASSNLLERIQADLNTSAEMLTTIESVRSQMQAAEAQTANDPGMADVHAAIGAAEQKFMKVEGNVIDLRLTGRGQDEVRYPVQIGGQLSYLASGIAASDFTPTAQQREVDALLAQRVKDTRAALQALLQTDLPRLNTLLRAKGLKTIDAGSIVF